MVDQEFRDRLVEEAMLKSWRRKTDRGLTWIYQKNLTLQVGGDVVVFYSDEPGDLGPIVSWVRQHFSGIYEDIDSLIRRIRRPHELTRDELTVIVTDPATIEEMKFSLHMKMEGTGTFYLKSPNPVTPGFKAYEYKGTLRCEFDCRDDKRRISALTMRRRLLEILPQIVDAPGLFAEYLTDFYNPYGHPILIDTGVNATLKLFSEFAEGLFDKMMDKMQGMMAPVPAVLPAGTPEDPIGSATDEVRRSDDYDIESIIMSVARHLKIERKAALVFLSAWFIWSGRQFQGRPVKEEIAANLRSQNEPLSMDEIADAIDQLQVAGLLEKDPRYDVKFTPAAARLGKGIRAKREGIF
jgi:hypothetical protein